MSMGFLRQEYWSGLLFHSPGDLPHLGIEPGYPALQVDSLPTEPPVRQGLLCMNFIMFRYVSSMFTVWRGVFLFFKS